MKTKMKFNFIFCPGESDMKMKLACFGAVASLAVLASGPARADSPAAVPAPAPAGPRIELAPPDEPQAGIPRPAVLRLPREYQIEVPLSQPATTGLGVGGYGEI